MKLNKTVWFILGVVLIVVLALMAVIPFARTAVWWIAAVCTVAMFGVCAVSVSMAFKANGNLESNLLGWPVFKVGYVMLAVQIVVGFILMGVAKLCPVFVAVIVELLIFAAAAIGLTVKSVARDAVTNSEVKIEDQTGEWKKLRAAMTALAATGNAELKKIAEEMRYADPIPTALDAEIGDVVEALKSDAGNNALIGQLKDLLTRRKSAAKAGKNTK